MMFADLVPSLIRTWVPLAVGLVATWLLDLGIVFPERGAVEEAVIAIVTGLYYLLVRVLEERWPRFGWLLGLAKKPEYPAEATPVAE